MHIIRYYSIFYSCFSILPIHYSVIYGGFQIEHYFESRNWKLSKTQREVVDKLLNKHSEDKPVRKTSMDDDSLKKMIEGDT